MAQTLILSMMIPFFRSSRTFFVTCFLSIAALSSVHAQSFRILKSFYTHDGAEPYGGLLLNGNTLYGTTTTAGGNYPPTFYGTVFKVNTDGTGFTVLKRFSGMEGNAPEGATPEGDLVLGGSTLYG